MGAQKEDFRMIIVMLTKRLRKIVNTLRNKNNSYVELEFKRFIDEMNDEGQDYMKGYGDGYSRACEDILKAIVEKKKK